MTYHPSDGREPFPKPCAAGSNPAGGAGSEAIKPSASHQNPTNPQANGCHRRPMTTPHQAHEPCTLPPPGWRCTRDHGHDGPCAAVPEPVVPLDQAGTNPARKWYLLIQGGVDLYRCTECSAVVTALGRADHRKWHDGLLLELSRRQP